MRREDKEESYAQVKKTTKMKRGYKRTPRKEDYDEKHNRTYKKVGTIQQRTYRTIDTSPREEYMALERETLQTTTNLQKIYCQRHLGEDIYILTFDKHSSFWNVHPIKTSCKDN